VPFSIEELVPPVSPIADGDAGLVIKADGSVQIFNTYNVSDPSQFTPEQLKIGETLVALSVALKVPAIMDILFQMAKDPEIVGTTH
jgi:hypothetical protein